MSNTESELSYQNPASDNTSRSLDITTLSDGSEVPTVLIGTVGLEVAKLLEKHGAFAAVDIRDLLDNKTPVPSPVVPQPSDTYSSLADFSQEPPKIHSSVAAILKNMIHVNPADEFNYAITDPRTSFEGFAPSSNDDMASQTDQANKVKTQALEATKHVPSDEEIAVKNLLEAKGYDTHCAVDWFSEERGAREYIDENYKDREYSIVPGSFTSTGTKIKSKGLTVFYKK